MDDSKKLLPSELAALVHHVELNRSGWWDKTLEGVVLTSIWLAETNPTKDQIRQTLVNKFGLTSNNGKLDSVLNSLETRDYIIRFSETTYRIAESKRKGFEADIANAERVEAEATSFFYALVAKVCPDLNQQDTWGKFQSIFLGPLIREIGANAYKLVAGEKMTLNLKLLKEFQKQFDDKHAGRIIEIVSLFLDPSNNAVRSYIARMLHATFCVEASGLKKEIIDKLNSSVGKPIQFRIFVDTNFLFSLLELHDNPSNSAATELKELIKTLGSNPTIDLYVTPRTIDEAKHSIGLAKERLTGFPRGANFNGATNQARFSGLDAKYLERRNEGGRCLSADEWFDPYLHNFVPLAREKGVELYNKKLEDYATRQDVVDDITSILKIEEKRGSRGKSYPMVEHDMILWHLVNDNRPGYVESAVEAKDWILTLDFRLIGFDEHKMKRRGGKVPICIHPTSLIQLLQFWIPRTPEFEEAILGSMRLPFLFSDLDSEAERTSLRILKGIGRLEDNDQIPDTAISRVMLNDGLRSRLGEGESTDEEAKLIRDALVDELRSVAEEHKGQAVTLAERLETKGSELEELKKATNQKENTIRELKARFSHEEEKVKDAQARITAQGGEIAEIKSQLEGQASREQRDKMIRKYLLLLIFIVLVSGATGWYGSLFLDSLNQLLGRPVIVTLLSICCFILSHLVLEFKLRKCSELADFWPFEQISRLRRWLWGFIILSFVAGIIGNLYASRIGDKLKEQEKSPTGETEILLEPVQDPEDMVIEKSMPTNASESKED
jgi:hypothetical protein